MAYKKNIFKDKTVVTLSTISILAAAALIGGMALDSGSKDEPEENVTIVDLNDDDTQKNSYDIVQYDEEETTLPIPEETSDPVEQPEVQEITDLDEDITSEEEPSEVSVNAPATKPGFTSDSILKWPVDGNIIIDYDMENTVYFPTLDLYKCSDAICIQSDIGTPVYASTTCTVNKIDYNEEIGSYVEVDLGNEYILTYGQLKDVTVNAGDTLEDGDLIGYVSEPSKYYSVEGPNLFLKLTENGTPVNPLDYLNYE